MEKKTNLLKGKKFRKCKNKSRSRNKFKVKAFIFHIYAHNLYSKFRNLQLY